MKKITSSISFIPKEDLSDTTATAGNDFSALSALFNNAKVKNSPLDPQKKQDTSMPNKQNLQADTATAYDIFALPDEYKL